jgi:hypothetical protein
MAYRVFVFFEINWKMPFADSLPAVQYYRLSSFIGIISPRASAASLSIDCSAWIYCKGYACIRMTQTSTDVLNGDSLSKKQGCTGMSVMESSP